MFASFKNSLASAIGYLSPANLIKPDSVKPDSAKTVKTDAVNFVQIDLDQVKLDQAKLDEAKLNEVLAQLCKDGATINITVDVNVSVGGRKLSEPDYSWIEPLTFHVSN